MNKISIYTLKALRKLYGIMNPESSFFGRNLYAIPTKTYSNELIYKNLISNKPTMIARIGSTEMLCLVNYLGVLNHTKNHEYVKYIKSQVPSWWWEPNMVDQMHKWSGFFPNSIELLERFAIRMIEDMYYVDILGSWLKEERFFKTELESAKKVLLEDLEPFFCSNPWTKALEGKRILIVHPFAETIKRQYAQKDLIFDNGLLPDFELITLKSVQSIAGEKTPFIDWFMALDYMAHQIESIEFDICILGCGAYGFPLAAHIKRMGKKAVHLGGVTQMLFGIKGGRWDNHDFYPYSNMYNEYWIRPSTSETPKNAKVVEDGCYW